MTGFADQGLINDFVDESLAHLETIEPDLLLMESSGDALPQETINRIFRAIHSIKGTSGFLELDSVKQLSHVMENLLMKIRDGEMTPTPEIVDALLKGADKLRVMIESVESCSLIPIDEELASLNVFLEGEGKTHLAGQASLKTENFSFAGNILTANGKGGNESFFLEIDKEKIREAASVGEVLALWVCRAADLSDKGRTLEQFVETAKQLGEIIASDIVSSDGADVCHFFYSTVMDAEFAQTGLDLPPDQVSALSKQDIDAILENVAEKPAAVPAADSEPPPIEKPVQTAVKSSAGKKPPAKSESPAQKETVRVTVELLDRLMNLAGELVLGRNQLRSELEKSKDLRPKVNSLMQNVGRFTTEIQEDIMRMRMQPMGNILNKFPRIVRDLSKRLGKKVELVVEGGEVELDKSILEGLSDPLTHLIRNCVDHGIELPEERDAAGKPQTGVIRIRAFHEGGQVNLVVADDGHGINSDVAARKAEAKGLVSAAELAKMTPKQKLALILLPGLSTAEKVTDVSGRGVGMDVVKTNIEKLGGRLELESEQGRGSAVRLILPLTLAIVPSIILGSGGQCFAIPQVNVKELVCIRAAEAVDRTAKIGDAEVLRLRGSLLPLVKLSSVLDLESEFDNLSEGLSQGLSHDPSVAPLLGKPMPDRRKRLSDRRSPSLDDVDEVKEEVPDFDEKRKAPDRRASSSSDLNIIILRVGSSRFGLVVDELFDNEEIVVKPLSSHIENCKCFSGATIMGDGRVALILDAAGVAAQAEMHFSEKDLGKIKELEDKGVEADAGGSSKHSVIIFNNALDEYFALPLASISRLEKVMAKNIMKIGAQEYVLSQGRPAPIARLENFLPVSPSPSDLEEIYLIIPKSSGSIISIAASMVFDTVEADATIERDVRSSRVFLGSAVVSGRLTTFLDPGELVALMDRIVFKDENNLETKAKSVNAEVREALPT